jgi:excisionase family DNA binding protein
MRAELIISEEIINQIVEGVADRLKPLLTGNSEDDDELIDIEQASKLLGASKDQIYQWVSNAKHGLKPFPFLKSGKRLRFSKKDLIQWMQNNKGR